MNQQPLAQSTILRARRNVRLFMAFRIFFNVRFYYPVFMILFLDFGITLEQFGILNAAWAAAIVLLEVPSGALADLFGRKRLLIAAACLMVVEMLLLCLVPVPSPWVFPALLLN
ncbi:MAG: MFS transporter, partial [Pirellulales bacterium]|nr:MFS transporter [Pirellulales bacterium]